jgi:glycosyltransferase involved in cell wall biosynthesis
MTHPWMGFSESKNMKILYGLTHPIQYQSPMIRHLVAAGVDLEVVYGRVETRFFDVEFGREVAWDIPLLEGYRHTALNQQQPEGLPQQLRRQFREQLLALERRINPQVLWIHGWSDPYARAFWDVAAQTGKPLLLRGDTCLTSVAGGWGRRLLHQLYYTYRFRHVAACLAIGAQNRQLYEKYGVPKERIFDMPYAVDNAFFQKRVAAAWPGREALRQRLGLEPGRPVVLFCGKLIALKGVDTLLEAVRRLRESADPGLPRPQVLLAGEGELRGELETWGRQHLAGDAHFLGFQNQSELPALYDLADVFVLPSNKEAYGLVVNEAMNAGKPVIASDQVGCWPDLVHPGVNGAVFPAGNAVALAEALRPYLLDPVLRERAGQASLEIINRWSFAEDLMGLRQALASLSVKA